MVMKVNGVLLLLTGIAAVQGVPCSNKYGSQKFPGYSCADILNGRCETPPDGIYWITLKASKLNSFPVFCDMAAGGLGNCLRPYAEGCYGDRERILLRGPSKSGWTLIFKAVAGVPGVISEYWNLAYPMYEYSTEALNNRSDFKHHYKNRIVQNWSAFKPKQARVVLYKKTKEEVALRFDARNSDNLNWFSMKNLQESPWRDISTKSKNLFGLKVYCHNGHCRDFIINHIHNGCPNDSGWFLVGTIRACKWETRVPEVSFFYSNRDTAVNLNKYDQVGLADIFAVYLR